MTLKSIKKIKWQLYITREVNFASEHFMHEGWLSFTKRIFGIPILKRINLYENGIASIFVSEEDIKEYTQYIKSMYQRGELRSLYLESMKNCKSVQVWVKTLKTISYKSLKNSELFSVYCDLRRRNNDLGPSLVLPRLVDLTLTSIDAWQNNKDIVSSLKDFSQLNEFRKMIISKQMSKEWLPLFQEIALRARLSVKEVFFLLPDEVETLLKENTEQMKNKIREAASKRIIQCLYVAIDGKTQSYEEGYEDLKNNLLKQGSGTKKKVITGRKACAGDVWGKAVVVLKKDDYRKVEQGDILITPMTQPEIGLVLNKIVGIITDEGGILAHASILANEQKIPCLTTTKTATTIIKDGDEIRLNASDGYVEVLSSYN